MAYSFMLVYDLGWRYALHDGYCSSWGELVKVCAAQPPNAIPDFCGYVVFRANKGEEYRLDNAWKMLEECGDLDQVRLDPSLGLASLVTNFVPSLGDGFGDAPSSAYRVETTQGRAPTKLSGILEKFVGNLEGKRMETQQTQEPEYIPTEEEKERWAAYREAVRYGLYGEYPDDDKAEKESA